MSRQPTKAKPLTIEERRERWRLESRKRGVRPWAEYLASLHPQTAEEKRRRNRERMMKKRRAQGVKPRSEWLAQAAIRTRPWEHFGIKRRAWQYRGRPMPPEAAP